ncbi:hypothetical protein [Anatilimnocola floriformis]|uniref:hypothetical protein n=1 Tax=Anatilimnocola floriformis TaxID=2948575 RepID=UPI0020C490B5|nr:hypothetical protein [Anatilimnocola floriformis]
MNAHVAQAPFFPPWYFWLFVFSLVVVIAGTIIVIVYLNVSAETERRRNDRETAARLIEVMVVQRKMSPEEVEQILNCYWQPGSFWSRFHRWFSRANPPVSSEPPKYTQYPKAS